LFTETFNIIVISYGGPGNQMNPFVENNFSCLFPMLKKLALPLTFVALVGVSGTSVGQTAANPDSALQEILQGLEGSPLSLHDAVRAALQNATSVRSAEAAYLAARGAVRRERGLFDPELFLSLNHLDQESPTASFFAGAPILITKQTTGSAGIRWDLPTGTELEASLSTVRLESNSQFAFLNPQYTAFGTLNLRQPLLGGFLATGSKDLSKAEKDLESQKARYDQEVLATSAETERSYWDLYAGKRNYAVQKLTRDRAEAFLKETETRARGGLVGPDEVANARTFLAEQQLLLLDREEQADRISDNLSSLMGMRPANGVYIPVNDPPYDFPIVPVDSLIARAFRGNLELSAAGEEVEGSRVLARAAGWSALPQIDLVGSLGGSGLAGTAQDVIFGSDTLRSTRGGTFGDAVSQATKRDFPTWSIGVEISIPIGFRNGLGEQDRLEAEVMSAEQRRIAVSRGLEDQVRSSYRELVHGRRRLEAAREGVDAAQEQVRIGLIEFQNGRSTAFELVRLGADFALSQLRYSEALVRTAKAAATLNQLTSGGYPGSMQNEETR